MLSIAKIHGHVLMPFSSALPVSLTLKEKKPKDKTIKIIEKTVMMEAEINKKHYPNWLKLPRDTWSYSDDTDIKADTPWQKKRLAEQRLSVGRLIIKMGL